MIPLAHPKRRGPQPAAFTLIELLVVVAIMALVAGSVVMVYDDVQQKAEQSVARRQLATVREALLRFRVDMGYFPGDGPLAFTSLNLTGYYYVDGSSPNTASPSAAILQQWAAHPLNLWMLYEKPVTLSNPTRWDWNPATAHGWRGPYLGQGLGAKLDAAGTLATGFLGGALSNRIYAVTDLIGLPTMTSSSPLRWVSEDRPVTVTGQPSKTLQPIGGRPVAFISDTISTPGWVIYRLVSAGPDGIFQTTTTAAGDDIVIEVARNPL